MDGMDGVTAHAGQISPTKPIGGDVGYGLSPFPNHPPSFMSPAQFAAAVAAVLPETQPSDAMRSRDISEIAAAIAEAQGKMVAPRRNRTVSVTSKRTQRTYTFQYSTLDVINDMLRGPLAESGIAIVHNQTVGKNGGQVLVTRAYKGSQWIGSSFPLIVDQDNGGAQAFGSAQSYAMRYNLKALFNIASDEDDDGSAASDNAISYRGLEAPARAGSVQTEASRTQAAYERLMRAAQLSRPGDRADGVTLLKLWQDRMEDLADWRDGTPEQHGAWEKLLDMVVGALARTINQDVAWTFNAILVARTGAERDTQNAVFSEKHKAGVDAVKRETPQAHALLMEHIRCFSAKIDEATRRAEEMAAMKAEVDAAEAEAIRRRNDELLPPQPQDDPVGLLVQQQEPARPVEHYLLDCTGDLDGDAYTSRMTWAKAFVRLYDATDEAQRVALNEHNDGALVWAMERADARKFLEDAFEAAVSAGDGASIDWNAPLRAVAPVKVPMNAKGSIDCLRYLQAIENSLDAVCDVPTMQAWLAANEPNYAITTFPIGTRTKILRAVTARRRALGMQPDAEP